LKPGRYQVKATREDYDHSRKETLSSRPGDVFPLEFRMKEILNGREGCGTFPRQPGLGPAPPSVASRSGRPALLIERASGATARGHRRTASAAAAAAKRRRLQRHSEPLGLRVSRCKALRTEGRVSVREGHWVRSFNRNKLKGDYPIIGNQTFLNVLFESDTFVDRRRLPVPSGLSSRPIPPISSDASDNIF